MFILEINWIAFIVAALLNTIIGAAWYSPAVFGKKLTEHTGKTKSIIAKEMYFYIFISSLILSYVLSIFIKTFGATKPQEGLLVGFIIWVGFVATTSMLDYLFSNRSSKLYFINNGYYLLGLLLMSSLIAAWV